MDTTLKLKKIRNYKFKCYQFEKDTEISENSNLSSESLIFASECEYYVEKHLFELIGSDVNKHKAFKYGIFKVPKQDVKNSKLVLVTTIELAEDNKLQIL